MRIGVDRYLQRFTEGYLPILERTKRLKILADKNGDPVYKDVSNLYDGERNAPEDANSQEGFISCQDPTDTSIWIVLVPKYLTPTAPSGSLKKGVCPSYSVGDPLFVGRLAEPVYIGPVDKNNVQEGEITYENSGIGNTHPFIADAFAADASGLYDRKWHEHVTEPSPTATSIDRIKQGSRRFYDPKLFCFYVDLNVDGRTRCAGGDVVITGGVSAPNVWL
jgi:hypothetical protein